MEPSTLLILLINAYYCCDSNLSILFRIVLVLNLTILLTVVIKMIIKESKIRITTYYPNVLLIIDSTDRLIIYKQNTFNLVSKKKNTHSIYTNGIVKYSTKTYFHILKLVVSQSTKFYKYFEKNNFNI